MAGGIVRLITFQERRACPRWPPSLCYYQHYHDTMLLLDLMSTETAKMITAIALSVADKEISAD